MHQAIQTKSTPTRGYGLLENMLVRQRIAVANALIPAAHRDGRILDIGCSEYPLFLLNTAFTERYGLDKITEGMTLSDGNGGQITLLCHDIERSGALPFADNRFDVVTMLAVFEHVEPVHLPDLLREIHRILKPGGTFILTTPAGWTDRLLRCMAMVRLVSPAEIQEHKSAYSHAKIGSLLQTAGYRQQDLEFGFFELYMNLWVKATKVR